MAVFALATAGQGCQLNKLMCIQSDDFIKNNGGTVGSIGPSQLQGHGIDPELGLCPYAGFHGFPLGPPTVQKM